MRLVTHLAARLDQARRDRAALKEARGLDALVFDDRPGSGGSLPARARAALKPDQEAWLVARAVSLRAF